MILAAVDLETASAYAETAGRAMGLGLGTGLAALGTGVGLGFIFGKWLGFALTEATVFYGFIAGLIAFFV
jgi:F-type H+-transporting ATPase subunit c